MMNIPKLSYDSLKSNMSLSVSRQKYAYSSEAMNSERLNMAEMTIKVTDNNSITEKHMASC